MMVLMKVMALDICDACELSDVQIGKNMTMEICFLVTQRNGLKSIVSDDYDIEDKRALMLTTMKTLEATMLTMLKMLTDVDYVDQFDDVDDVDNEDVRDRWMLTMLTILTIWTMWTIKTLETGGSPKCGGQSKSCE